MKNLKKVLALVVVFSMMLGTVAFASSFPDVADDASYKNAIETLAALNFFVGDENGNFNPDSTITRAEFATIVCRLLGIENAAAGTADFADVPADHWASGYISMAAQYGVIVGYGDGNFGPEDPVKYEEAVKMLVCALGYQPMADTKGGYPTGYLVTASQIGLLSATNGTQGTGAPRSLVAQLTYNALDIPMMEQQGFGTEVQYVVMKRVDADGQDKVTLLTKLGIYKLGGIITANSKVAYSGTSPVDVGFVQIDWDDHYDSPVKEWIDREDADDSRRRLTLDVNGTDAEDMIGLRVITYVSEYASRKYQIEAIEVDQGLVETLSVDARDLDDSALDFMATSPTFKYYKDGATRSTTVDLAPDYTVVWNNEVLKTDVSDTFTGLNSNLVADLELIDWDNDGYFDVLKVIEYAHYVVDSVNTETGVVTTYNGRKVDLGYEDDEAVVSIKDVNGNVMDAADIENMDVLAIVVSPKSANLNSGAYDSLEITVLKDSVVNGTVTEYDNTDNEVVVGIDGTDYEVADEKDALDIEKIDLSASGDFFIGINGKIIGYMGTRATNKNYGVIMYAYEDANPARPGTMQILNKDGVFKTYELADAVRFINPNDGKYQRETVKNMASDALVKSMEDTYWNGIFGDVDSKGNVSNKKVVKTALAAAFPEITADTGTEAEILAKRAIKFKTNEEDQITEIIPAALGASSDDLDMSLTDETDSIYRANGQRLGSKLIADDAVIFDIDMEFPEDSKVSDVGFFVDDSTYSALLLDKDSDGYFGGAVVYDADTVYEDATPLAIVLSKTTATDEYDNEAVKVTVMVAGEEKELLFTENSRGKISHDGEDGLAAQDFGLGTILMYSASASNEVINYTVVGNTSVSSSAKNFTFDSTFKTNAVKAGSDITIDVEDGDAFYYGYIISNTRNRRAPHIVVTDQVSTMTTGFEDFTFTVDSSANQYTFSGTSRNPSIGVGSYTDGMVDNIPEFDENGELLDGEKVYYVLVRTFEDSVVDIISFEDNGHDLAPAYDPDKGTTGGQTPGTGEDETGTDTQNPGTGEDEGTETTTPGGTDDSGNDDTTGTDNTENNGEDIVISDDELVFDPNVEL